MLHEKDPEDTLLASRFIDFLRNKGTQEGKPEQIAQEFECWQERNQT